MYMHWTYQMSFMVYVCVIPQYSLILVLYVNDMLYYMKMETMVISAMCFNVLLKNQLNWICIEYHANFANDEICWQLS